MKPFQRQTAHAAWCGGASGSLAKAVAVFDEMRETLAK